MFFYNLKVNGIKLSVRYFRTVVRYYRTTQKKEEVKPITICDRL